MSAPFPELPTAPSPPTEPPDGTTDPAPRGECANCGAPLIDAYCGTCGQRAAGGVVPLWQVGNEFLEDLFDLDLRILRTFPTFFFRPGRLTAEYVRGRRRRYIRPLRLYLFSSFLLFTVLALTDVGAFSFSFDPTTPEAQADLQAARHELEALRAELAGASDGAALSSSDPLAAGSSRTADPGRTAGLRSSLPASAAPSVDRGLQRAAEVLAALDSTTHASGTEAQRPAHTGERRIDGTSPVALVALPPDLVPLLGEPKAFVRDLIDRAPYLMFVLVPTFALLLKGLYLRRRRLYLEHLIFALHVHAFAFILFAAGAGLGHLNVGAAVHLDWWLALTPFGYLFLAMRHVYGQSLGRTAGKTLALLVVYGIILVAAVVALIVASVGSM